MRIDRLRLRSRDVGCLAGFYRAAFDARPLDFGVALGEERIEFVQAETPDSAEFAANEIGFQHFAIVVSDMAAAYAHLCTFVEWRPISLGGPEHLPTASGGAVAFKFRDPSGHPLELLQFASDAVPAHWRAVLAAAPNRLFHGLDHTALSVSDAEASLAFYARLGFVCERRRINVGAEQRNLDGFADAQETTVEILSLSPPDGSRPGIELLAYRKPPPVLRSAHDGSSAATSMVMSQDLPHATRDPDGHRLDCAAEPAEP